MSNRGRHKNNKHPLVKLLGAEITNKMMYYQIMQGNKPNLDVFLKDPGASKYGEGFTWDRTDEGFRYWSAIYDKIGIYNKNHHDRS